MSKFKNPERDFLHALYSRFTPLFRKLSLWDKDCTLPTERMRIKCFQRNYTTIEHLLFSNRDRVSRIDILSMLEYFEQRVRKGSLVSSTLSVNCFKRKPVARFPDFGVETPVGVDVYLGPRCRCINEYLGFPNPDFDKIETNVGPPIAINNWFKPEPLFSPLAPNLATTPAVVDPIDELVSMMCKPTSKCETSPVAPVVDCNNLATTPAVVDPIDELVSMMCKPTSKCDPSPAAPVVDCNPNLATTPTVVDPIDELGSMMVKPTSKCDTSPAAPVVDSGISLATVRYFTRYQARKQNETLKPTHRYCTRLQARLARY
jgi:hypothetical protein